MIELTSRQAEILDYIKSFIAHEGMSPTLQEIADHFGFLQNSARDHLMSMEKKGAVYRISPKRGSRHVARNIRVQEQPCKPRRTKSLTVKFTADEHRAIQLYAVENGMTHQQIIHDACISKLES